jgi:hypothetical protein
VQGHHRLRRIPLKTAKVPAPPTVDEALPPESPVTITAVELADVITRLRGKPTRVQSSTINMLIVQGKLPLPRQANGRIRLFPTAETREALRRLFPAGGTANGR